MKYIYVTKEEALAAGMTNHGVLFGAPVWMKEDGEEVIATPKFIPLRAWLWLCDNAYEFATYFMNEDRWLEIPLVVGEKIE